METGEILKLTCGNGPDHYDGNVTPHYHFVCRDCGQVYDMELDEMADLNTSVQAAAPGKIDSHSILFYGRCYSCMEKEEKENRNRHGKGSNKIRKTHSFWRHISNHGAIYLPSLLYN